MARSAGSVSLRRKPLAPKRRASNAREIAALIGPGRWLRVDRRAAGVFASSPENWRPVPGQDLIAGLAVIDDEPRQLHAVLKT